MIISRASHSVGLSRVAISSSSSSEAVALCIRRTIYGRRGKLAFPSCQYVTSFSTQATTSATKPSFFTSPLDWWKKRQEGQEVEKYKERVMAMAEKDVWAVGDMVDELDEVVNSWKAKMPGVSSLRETEMAKKMYKTLQGIVKVAGRDASEDTLSKMTRKEKLMAAIEGETTVEEINTTIDQFRVMTLMQKVIRQQKLSGKTIPSTPEGVQALVQAQGSKLLSKAQKSKMGKDQVRKIMRSKR